MGRESRLRVAHYCAAGITPTAVDLHPRGIPLMPVNVSPTCPAKVGRGKWLGRDNSLASSLTQQGTLPFSAFGRMPLDFTLCLTRGILHPSVMGCSRQVYATLLSDHALIRHPTPETGFWPIALLPSPLLEVYGGVFSPSTTEF